MASQVSAEHLVCSLVQHLAEIVSWVIWKENCEVHVLLQCQDPTTSDTGHAIKRSLEFECASRALCNKAGTQTSNSVACFVFPV